MESGCSLVDATSCCSVFHMMTLLKTGNVFVLQEPQFYALDVLVGSAQSTECSQRKVSGSSRVVPRVTRVPFARTSAHACTQNVGDWRRRVRVCDATQRDCAVQVAFEPLCAFRTQCGRNGAVHWEALLRTLPVYGLRVRQFCTREALPFRADAASTSGKNKSECEAHRSAAPAHFVRSGPLPPAG